MAELKESDVRYAIDAEDNICFVDEGWYKFADANGGDDLKPPAVLGRSLWDCISDQTTRDLYQRIVERVRKGKLARFTLRCDSPECRRLLEMTISSAADGTVEFGTSVLSLENREPVELLSSKVLRSTEMLRVCAWCNRINLGAPPDDWVEVEDAAEHLGLFERELMPELTHGICKSCYESMMGTLAKMDASEEINITIDTESVALN